MRIFSLILGLALIGNTVANNMGNNPLPFDTAAISFSIIFTTVTLDTVLMVTGMMLLIGVLVFGKLGFTD